jgi:hypothetical protein
MTFRILNDEALGQVASHILGGPTHTHPRTGSVSGTDVHMPVGNSKEYDGGTGHSYDSGGTTGGYQQGGGGQTPPTPGFGQQANIDCAGGVPQLNGGGCPEDGNGWVWQQDENGIGYCCPMLGDGETGGGGDGGGGGGTRPFCTVEEGSVNDYGAYDVAKSRQANASRPFNGDSPSTWLAKLIPKCRRMHGRPRTRSWTRDPGEGQSLVHMRAWWCCRRGGGDSGGGGQTGGGQTGGGGTPPDGTGTGTGQTGGGGGSLTPAQRQIVFQGYVLQDLDPGAYGWLACGKSGPKEMRSNCEKEEDPPHPLGKKGSGFPDCDDEDHVMMWAHNPGSAKIDQGQNVVSVRDFIGATTVTIVVVPCSTS